MLSSYQAQIIEQQKLYGPGITQPKETLEDIIKKNREELVKQYSKYDKYRIAIQDDDNLRNWHIKIFKRHKITTIDFAKAKEISDIINNKEENIEPAEADEYGIVEDEELDNNEEDDKQIEYVLQYYKFLAGCYLKMTEQEFDRCDWGKLRLVVDACQHNTVHPFVEGSQGMFEFFHLEDAKGEAFTKHLTNKDYEALKMYRLWLGKAKIKPSTINGGMWYEEDINIFLKIEELQISGDKLKDKKRKWREDHVRGGGGGVGNASATMGPDGVLHKHTTKFRNR